MTAAKSAAPPSAPGSAPVTVSGPAVPDCHECGWDYPSVRAADRCADQDRDDDREARLVAAHKQPHHRTDDD